MKRDLNSYIFYGFRIDEMEHLPTARVIGWQLVEPHHQYDWDCSIPRPQVGVRYIFQYTVSGEGMIEMDGVVCRLRAGQAFLVERPGPFRYYLPAGSSHWEIKFVELANVQPHWHDITKHAGRMIDLNGGNDLIGKFDEMYYVAENKAFEDTYHNSTLAYAFLMKLKQQALRARHYDAQPAALQRAMKFIQANYHQPIGIPEISRRAGLSISHFSRLFVAVTGVTPLQYLIRVRITNASQLLVNNESIGIDEVARRCGFANGNYFAKVFRKITHVSPEQFRQDEALQRSTIHFI